VLNNLSWKEHQPSFEGLAPIGYASLALTGRGAPEQFQGNTISPSLMPALGIQPVAGRNFRGGPLARALLDCSRINIKPEFLPIDVACTLAWKADRGVTPPQKIVA
jgi:hypothetical protein